MRGIIVKGIGGFYYVKCEDQKIYECKARGIFRKHNIKPIIGDRVLIEVDNDKGNIIEIEERHTVLVRPPVSNVDNLMIVVASKNPNPDFLLIDKMIVTAEAKGINPIICINKTDLDEGEEIRKTYEMAGYPVLLVSTYEEKGLDELKTFLKGKVTAFAGLSGVGKSSILNELVDFEAETGDISDKIKRGKHTTRHVELFELTGGGYILDTPGFSSFEMEGIKAAELCGYFPEMQEHSGCRFKGCAHINEPDCGVKEKVAMGQIDIKRYENYKEIYEILVKRKDWE